LPRASGFSSDASRRPAPTARTGAQLPGAAALPKRPGPAFPTDRIAGAPNHPAAMMRRSGPLDRARLPDIETRHRRGRWHPPARRRARGPGRRSPLRASRATAEARSRVGPVSPAGRRDRGAGAATSATAPSGSMKRGGLAAAGSTGPSLPEPAPDPRSVSGWNWRLKTAPTAPVSLPSGVENASSAIAWPVLSMQKTPALGDRPEDAEARRGQSLSNSASSAARSASVAAGRCASTWGSAAAMPRATGA